MSTPPGAPDPLEEPLPNVSGPPVSREALAVLVAAWRVEAKRLLRQAAPEAPPGGRARQRERQVRAMTRAQLLIEEERARHAEQAAAQRWEDFAKARALLTAARDLAHLLD